MAGRVLIVDDAVLMRSRIREILESAGYDVVGEASNGAEGVEKYAELKPDVVTMDIVMPVMGGLDAVREIVSRDARARIVMCSALGQENLVMEAIQAGAREFITKPFRAERVLEVIGKVVQS